MCDAAAGDAATLTDTVVAATENLAALKDDARVADKVADDFAAEAVLDKGYHSNEVLADLEAMGVRTYASEPARGRRSWDGDLDARDAVYANRRRVKGDRGRRLLRSRGERLERTFAHCYETGGMRRLHLRGRANVAKRALVHAAAFNVGLLMRVRYGLRKPRGLTARAAAAAARAAALAVAGRVRAACAATGLTGLLGRAALRPLALTLSA